MRKQHAKTCLKERIFREDIFDTPEAEALIMSPIPGHEQFLKAREELHVAIDKITPELRGFYEEPLLTSEQERHLFRQFNFLKHQAAKDPSLTDKALLIKKQLAASNVRLVMNIAKEQKEYASNPDIDLLAELVSDGYVALMHSVDGFDYRLGHKFSTYATYAILNAMRRGRQYRNKYAMHVSSGLDEILEEIPQKNSEEYEDSLPKTAIVRKMLGKIPRRNRQVIVEIFGLKGKPRKLHEIGEKLGVSKERVRQLKARGLAMLKRLGKIDACN